jgi:hypothetical protein
MSRSLKGVCRDFFNTEAINGVDYCIVSAVFGTGSGILFASSTAFVFGSSNIAPLPSAGAGFGGVVPAAWAAAYLRFAHSIT